MVNKFNIKNKPILILMIFPLLFIFFILLSVFNDYTKLFMSLNFTNHNDSINSFEKNNPFDSKESIQAELKRLLDNKRPIDTVSWFKDLSKIINTQSKNLYLIVFLPSICDSCFSGVLLSYLKNIYENYFNEIYIIIFLPLFYSPQDIENFKLNFALPFEVLVSPPDLYAKWVSFNDTRQKPKATFLILVNRIGQVIKIFDDIQYFLFNFHEYIRHYFSSGFKETNAGF